MLDVVYVLGMVGVVGVVTWGKFVVTCGKSLTLPFICQIGGNCHSMVGVVCEFGLVGVIGVVFVVDVVICGKIVKICGKNRNQPLLYQFG